MISKITLQKLYETDKLSAKQIADKLNCSHSQVIYWMDRHDIKRRSISEAIYQRSNPDGDPFYIKEMSSKSDYILLGMGLGLYWGEGTKANKYSVRLGNSDPDLLRTFIGFLVIIFGVKASDLRFGLQLFTDIDKEEALDYWTEELCVQRSQFYKPHITISGSIGTYKKKSRHGVVTIYFHNKKLRDIIIELLPR